MQPNILLLALCFTAVRGHLPIPGIFGLDLATSARLRISPRHEHEPQLESRASGQVCGIQNNNASCSAGQCCSAQGQCGTGRSFCDAPFCQFQFGPACDANMMPLGANTGSISRPKLGSIPYADTNAVLNCTKPGYVALTFDDGPYEYTSILLDILKANNVPATFFVTSNNMGKKPIDWHVTGYPTVIQRMITEGHQIGSHTWSHQDLNVLSTQERHDQMVKAEMALVNILGFWPTYMRPPYDSCQTNTGCRRDVGALGYHNIGYNIYPQDSENLTPDSYILSQNNVTHAMAGGTPATNNYIIYGHDILPLTALNLTQWIIDTVKGQGYKFATVGDCLEDPKENWYRDPSTGNGVDGTVMKPANASTSDISSTPSSPSTAAVRTGTHTSGASSLRIGGMVLLLALMGCFL